MDNIAVLIPCYNEHRTVAKVITDFKTVLPNATIYVYDNNSTDGTGEIAKNSGAIVRKVQAQGKGNVIRTMFREVDADCYVMVDGDDTYPAEAASEMVKRVLHNGIDMVIGDRLSSTYYKENKRRFHSFGNDLVKNSVNRLFRSDIKDIMTGYRAFSYQFVKSLPVLSKGFEIETEMSIHAIDKNMQLDTLPVAYRDRSDESQSKLNTITDGFKVLKTIVLLLSVYKPLLFYGTISAVLLGLSLSFFVPVLIEYAQTGLVQNFPTLIVCGFVALAALQAFFIGLLLETINKKNRQDFEMRLVQIATSREMMRLSDSAYSAD